MEMSDLKALIADELNVEVEDVREDSNFIDDLGADSLDLFELAMSMEEKYDIEIPSDDLQEIKTVQDAANYIQQKMQ